MHRIALLIFAACTTCQTGADARTDVLASEDWQAIKSQLADEPANALQPKGSLASSVYLKASNTDAGDGFGYAVAVSGDTVVVGAYREDSFAAGVNGNQGNSVINTNSGAAYVFKRTGAVWTQQAYLKSSNPEASDQFGFSVSIDGDTIVVGAPMEDSLATGVNGNQADNTFMDAGAAYVFTRTGETWSQQAYLKASNTGPEDQFGYSVSVSGDSVLVGAYQEDISSTGVNGSGNDGATSNSGAAYVFIRDAGNTWSQQAFLKASNTGRDDGFGFSVAMDADTAVVGAFLEDSSAAQVDGDDSNDGAMNAGAAYVFFRTAGQWSQQAYLKPSNTNAEDIFGYDVAVDADSIVVGALQEDSQGIGVDSAPDDNSAPGAGAAYVFRRDQGSWSQEAYLKPLNTEADDRFGLTVSIDGNLIAVGAFFEDSFASGVNGNPDDNLANNAGAAYVFARATDTWAQQDYLKATNTGADDFFGFSVGIDGVTAVVGAVFEDGSGTGVNANGFDNLAEDAGAAYIYGLPVSDLTPSAVSVTPMAPIAAESINIATTVSNLGSAGSDPTMVRFLQSADAVITPQDALLGETSLPTVTASGSTMVAIDVAAPPAGSYFFGACVVAPGNEFDTTNNCSGGTMVEVSQAGPDHLIDAVTLMPASPRAGNPFQFDVTVRNAGDVDAEASMLRFFRSDDGTIDPMTDDEIGSPVALSALAISASEQLLGLATAPAAGTHFFGACVDAVAAEANPDNNCSAGVATPVQEATVTVDFSGVFLLDNGQPNVADQGDQLRFTADIENVSMSDEPGVMLLVGPVAGFTIDPLSVSAPGGVVIKPDMTDSDRLQVDFGILASAQTETVIFDATVDLSEVTASAIEVQARIEADATDALSQPISFPAGGTVGLDAALAATVLIDNDFDGLANRSDVIRYSLELTGTAERAAGPITFSLATPAHTTLVTGSVQLQGLPGGQVISGNNPGEDSVVVMADRVPGGMSLSDAVMLDVQVNDQIPGEPIEAQGTVVADNLLNPLATDGDPGSAGDNPTSTGTGLMSRLDLAGTAAFGSAVATGNFWAAIGSPEDMGGRGNVHVFPIDEAGNLGSGTVLDVPGMVQGFGASVALSGNTLVVGATDRIGGKGNDPSLIAVYTVSGGSWTLADTVPAGFSLAGAEFGRAVAIDGNLIAVGAPGASGGNGQIALFDFDGSNATSNSVFEPSNAMPGSRFGAAVAVSGNLIAGAAPGGLGGAAEGSVIVLELNGGLSDIATLDGTGRDAMFGAAVDLDGNRLLIGAPDPGTTGAAYAFTIDNPGTTFVAEYRPQAGTANGALFGASVGLAGNLTIVGAPNDSAPTLPMSGMATEADLGAVYLFDEAVSARKGAAVMPTAKLGAFAASTAVSSIDQMGFGSALAATSTVVVIGAPESAGGAGSAAARIIPQQVFGDGFE